MPMNLNRSASWPYSFKNVRPLNANVQSPFVACVTPLEVTSKAFCTWCKTAMQTFKSLLFILQNSDATIQSRIVPTTKRMVISGVSPFTSTYKPISVIGTYLIKNNFVGKGLNKGVFSSRECLKQSEMLSLSDWIAIRIFISPFAHLLLREVKSVCKVRELKPYMQILSSQILSTSQLKEHNKL